MGESRSIQYKKTKTNEIRYKKRIKNNNKITKVKTKTKIEEKQQMENRSNKYLKKKNKKKAKYLIINPFEKIAHSNNKQTQLVTHNILHTTSKKISLAVTTPKINDKK